MNPYVLNTIRLDICIYYVDDIWLEITIEIDGLLKRCGSLYIERLSDYLTDHVKRDPLLSL